MEVVSRLSVKKSSIYAALVLLFTTILVFVLLYHPDGVSLSEYLNEEKVIRWESEVVGWAVSLILVITQLFILYRLIFHGRIGIWLVGDRLSYIDINSPIFIKTINVGDILSAQISTKELTRVTGIFLTLRGGRNMCIPTRLLENSRSVILDKINQLTHTSAGKEG